MATKKKNPVVQTERDLDVGHGCVDCLHYELPNQKVPCKDCVRWSAWKPSKKYEDKLLSRIRYEEERAAAKKSKRKKVN